MLHYEDIVVGAKSRFGRYEVTREEVVKFARKYDPQAFHLDEEAAAATHFGRLSASGWHTCAMTMAMIIGNMKLRPEAGLGSPGVDELRWSRPVYPGDTLSVENEVLSKRRSRSRRDMGLLKSRTRTFNQHGEVVLDMIANTLIQVRDPGAPID